MSGSFQFRIERDRDLLSDADLARVIYRREGTRRWAKFVVVLDDDTTFETVEANAEHLILLYEHGPGVESTSKVATPDLIGRVVRQTLNELRPGFLDDESAS